MHVSEIKNYDQGDAAIWSLCLVGYTTKPGLFHVNTASLFYYNPMQSLNPTARWLIWGMGAKGGTRGREKCLVVKSDVKDALEQQKMVKNQEC